MTESKDPCYQPSCATCNLLLSLLPLPSCLLPINASYCLCIHIHLHSLLRPSSSVYCFTWFYTVTRLCHFKCVHHLVRWLKLYVATGYSVYVFCGYWLLCLCILWLLATVSLYFVSTAYSVLPNESFFCGYWLQHSLNKSINVPTGYSVLQH